jgi:hypothetical protein
MGMRYRLALAGLLLLAASPARAALLAYEPFDYPAGVLAGRSATGQGLTGTYPDDPVAPDFLELRAEAPGLDYGNLVGAPGARGNRLDQNQGTTAADAVAALASPISIDPGNEIFFGALFVFDDSTNANRLASISLLGPNDDTLTFGEPAVGSGAIRLSVATSATGGNPVGPGADNAFSDGQTLFLFGRYQNGAAPQSDRLDLVGYDTASAIQLPAIFDPADPAAQLRFTLADATLDFTQITAVRFTIRGTSNNFIDELRVGTSYGDVVPEPSAAPLCLLGLAGLALRRRLHSA